MKKVILLLVICAICISSSLKAQVLMNETFNYSSTKLANVAGDPNTSATNNTVGVWYNTGKSTDSNSASIMIDSEPLYYVGYINSGVGKSAKIENSGSGINTRLDVVRFTTDAEKIKTGVLYYAFLMNVGDLKTWSTTTSAEGNDWRDVFVIAEGGTDVLGNSLRGRLFMQQDATDPSIIKYTIVKNTSISSTTLPDNVGTISPGQTYLFVIKQTFTGDANCKVEIIHNPIIGSAEPTTGWINGKPGDTNTFGGTYGIGIRRRNFANSANVFISGIRVAKTYGEAVGFSTGLTDNILKNREISTIGKSILTSESGNLTIYNLSGAEVLTAKTTGKLETSLSKGMYLVKFINDNGFISSGKIQLK